MHNLIDRNQAIKDLSEWTTNILNPEMLVKEDALHILETMDGMDAEVVKHGKWIHSRAVPSSTLSECSLCGFDTGAWSFKYCPMCGARMDG